MVQLVITSRLDANLIAASSKVAQSAELHSMVHDNGVMKMRQVDKLELPAGKTVDFGEAGYHLMLMGLKHPIVEGTRIEILLTVRLADGKEVKVKVKAMVRALTDSTQHENMHH
jgi:copper(I)-binding protein